MMVRIMVCVVAWLVTAAASAGINFRYTPDQSLYVHVQTASSTFVHIAIADGTGQADGCYTLTDAQLVSGALTTNCQSTIFASGFPFAVTAHATSSVDPLFAGTLDWDGDSERITSSTVLDAIFAKLPAGNIAGAGATYADLDDVKSGHDTLEAAIEAIDAGGGTPIAPTTVHASRTWQPSVDGAEAANIITVNVGFTGTLAARPPLNEDADIETFDSVTLDGPTAVATEALTITADGREAHFDVEELDTAGDYEVLVTVTTKDGQTIPFKCLLQVR